MTHTEKAARLQKAEGKAQLILLGMAVQAEAQALIVGNMHQLGGKRDLAYEHEVHHEAAYALGNLADLASRFML